MAKKSDVGRGYPGRQALLFGTCVHAAVLVTVNAVDANALAEAAGITLGCFVFAGGVVTCIRAYIDARFASPS